MIVIRLLMVMMRGLMWLIWLRFGPHVGIVGGGYGMWVMVPFFHDGTEQQLLIELLIQVVERQALYSINHLRRLGHAAIKG